MLVELELKLAEYIHTEHAIDARALHFYDDPLDAVELMLVDGHRVCQVDLRLYGAAGGGEMGLALELQADRIDDLFAMPGASLRFEQV